MNKATLHEHFTDQGFERVEYEEISTYQLNIICQETGASYPLYVKMEVSEQGHPVVKFEEAYFEESEAVPLHVRKSALDKLMKLEQLIHDSAPQANNSSMAQNFEEMKKLGNEMKNTKTGSELLEESLTPDPIQ